MIPLLPGVAEGCVLVVWDVSGSIYQAFHAGGIESMESIVAGKLRKLLSPPVPAWLCAALDTPGTTWRHRLARELSPEQRYKANRPPRPLGWERAVNRIEELIALHNIPLLAAEGWEADDAWAWAVRQGRGMGVPVVGLTVDKDWGQLVTDEWPPVALWNPDEGTVTREEDVLRRWGVKPALLGDLLALVGDNTDNIAGVDGLGPVKAAHLLNNAGTLERLLATPPLVAPPPESITACERAIAKLKRAKRDSSDEKAMLDAMRHQRRLAEEHQALLAQADRARLARQLVALDAEGPFAWAPELLPVGGFHVEQLRERYLQLGWTNMAAAIA